ncbi:MAG: glycosyltransferase, partial [Fusobacterium sp.]
YNIYMNIETYIKSKNIKKLIEKLGKIDVFIDYDAGATKYIENIEADKKVVWIHNSIPNLKKSESKIKRFGKRLEKYDKIVAICDEMKEELIDIYPNLKDKILRIYNPFNFSRVLNLKDDLSELNEKDRNLLKEDYCIAISRLDTVQKDYKTLLKAFQILKSKGIDKKLYIVGDGPSKEEIKNMIKEYNLIEEVKLLGRFKNPYVWLNNADFFIHSSKYEGFGLVLIEAAILDKLIISSNCPVGPTEILENGKSGILFNVGDSQELAEKIEKVLNDKNLRNRYILSMKERREDFKKENVLKEYEKLIDEI